MILVVFVACAITVVNGQRYFPGTDQPLSLTRQDSFKPYAFNYDALRNDGQIQNSRSESTDGSGRVRGSYFLTNDEGHYREVLYLADEDGFRTIIRTNEPGTKSSNPAGVVMEYSSEIRRQFQNIAQESIAPLFNSVFGSSSQGSIVNPFSGILPPTRVTSPSGSDLPPERPPLINGKGPVFEPPKKVASRSPLFSNSDFRPGATYSQDFRPGATYSQDFRQVATYSQDFRPGATYSQGPFPPLNQLPGFLSPKGINSLSDSDFPRGSLVNGKGPVFEPPK